MPPAPTYAFGEFTLDGSTKRLTRGGEPVPLTEHQSDVLLQLVEDIQVDFVHLRHFLLFRAVLTT